MMTRTRAEREILAILDAHAAAHHEHDVAGLMDLYAADAVSFTLAPPLQQTPDSEYGSAAGLRAWFATFDGPVRVLYRDAVVTVDGTVAFVHTLSRMTATPTGAPEPFTLWFRSTFGLRLDGTWRITHWRESTPFHMDGSFRAAVDLHP